MNTRTKILVKEDDGAIRSMYAHVFARQPGLQLVASVPTWVFAVHHAMEWDLDLLMCNIKVHTDECIDSVRRIKRLCPRVAVLFCSAFDEAYSLEFALRTQPRGYLCKPFREETLIEAINAIAEGGMYFSEKIQPWVEMGPDGPAFR